MKTLIPCLMPLIILSLGYVSYQKRQPYDIVGLNRLVASLNGHDSLNKPKRTKATTIQEIYSITDAEIRKPINIFGE